MKAYIIFFVLVLYAFSFAQEQYIELARSDFKTKKVAVITEAMQFTPEESEIFWPIYRDYDYEYTKIGDQEIALIKDYAENFETLTDEKTVELMTKSFSIDNQLLDLRETYFNKISEALNPKLAARFMQIESQIQNFVQLSMASQIPLVGDVLEDMKVENTGTDMR
ncbi:MAG: hypothetical protein R3250_15260 [Melioribacteraceae bacterium]|nr:hypothetical protein [Melioribacteraceae bacterium]